jgi:hypothetical protein
VADGLEFFVLGRHGGVVQSKKDENKEDKKTRNGEGGDASPHSKVKLGRGPGA